MWLGIINLAGYESGLEGVDKEGNLLENPDAMTHGTELQVLQDTFDAGAADDYGASKWYIYLIDREGYPRLIHYQLDLEGERQRLLDEIAELVGEGT